MSRVSRALIGLGLRRHHRKLWGQLAEQAQRPEAAQQSVLAEILRRQSDTSFGREHRFDQVGSPAEYADRVAVHDYEQLRPHIERQRTSTEPVLTVEAPILYSRTSGTTGDPKFIPVTPTGLARQTTARRLLASMVGRHTAIFGGYVLGIGSPAVEGRFPEGAPYGSASGMIFDGMPPLVRRRYLLSSDIAAISDDDERYRAMALAAMAEPQVTALATANPSTLLRLRQVMVEQWDDLAREAASRNPARGRALRAISNPAELNWGQLWPRLELVTTWTRGSCGLALDRLARWLPDTVKTVELGYTASELTGTTPLRPGRPDCAPLLGDVYFEFAERDAWESGRHEFQGIAELEVAKQYYVFITTVDGLYRYDMNDILEVAGRYHNTPTFVFIQKGRGVTSITGEKLHESQLIDALKAVGRGAVPGSGFFVALADPAASQYRIYIEALSADLPAGMTLEGFAERLDAEMARLNIEYKAKRASRRLEPPAVCDLPAGSGDRYRRACLSQGQRDTQYKVLHLQYQKDCPVDLAAWGRG